MSALAVYCSRKGYRVSGSDRAFDADSSHPLRPVLDRAGITVFPQDGSGVRGANAVITSTAVEDDRPDLVVARDGGIPLLSRPGVFGELIGSRRSIAVAGTSGKSTTAGMLAFVLHRLGLSPSFLGGGSVKAFRTPDNPGNALVGGSDLLVAEACESDGALAGYRPEITLIANLALDHRGVEETADLFRALAEGTRGAVIVNADDGALKAAGIRRSAAYGTDAKAEFRCTERTLEGLGSSFTCNGTRFRLRVPGRHNVENALAVLAVLGEMGIPLHRAVGPLGDFDGIVGRFDVHGSRGDILVVHDYAHNPHKIAALMDTVAAACSTPVAYVFQPHGYGPTRLLREGYRKVFRSRLRPGDLLFVLPIFDPGGTAARDIASNALVEGLFDNALGETGLWAESVQSRDELLARVDEAPVWIVFGARDESLGGLAREIAQRKLGRTEAVP